MSSIDQITAGIATGESSEIDLSRVVHDRARHAELVPWSVLAWWVLGARVDLTEVRCILPAPGSSPLRHLARSGVVSAAVERNLSLVHSDGRPFEWKHLYADPASHQDRLPGVDWAVLDDQGKGDRLRIIPDLSDLRRTVQRDESTRIAFPWLAKLGLSSPAISPDGYQRFLGDAGAVLRELIDNVHRWSRAKRAFASVSVTRGGAIGGGSRESWNRLHIVIADAGVGIPVALRSDLAALHAVHQAAEDDTLVDDLADPELVTRLLRHAFGARQIPNHNGHGLNAAQIRAGQWVGALDVVTCDTDGRPFRLGCRGLGQTPVETDAVPLKLPTACGTLIHLMLQGTDQRDSRRSAASAEELPFDDRPFDEIVRESQLVASSSL